MAEGVLLVDVDSTIPNLALMHLSTYYKQQGEKVGFNIPDPRLVYASCVFDWNRHKTDGLKFLYPDATIDIGGSGVNLTKTLGGGIDMLMPDYSLYPACDYDLGFTTRGCIRNCPFCIVPKKEGSFKKAVYMDNNILANPDWFNEVADYTISNKIKIDFDQGLDLRLITPEIAEKIAECKTFKPWRFAFDNLALKDQVLRAFHLLDRAGVRLRWNAECYVYCNGEGQLDSAIERCNILRSIGVMPYPMFDRHAEITPRMRDLKKWCRPWIFYSIPFNEFKRGV